MTLPTGTISMSQVNTELGNASTTTISLNQATVRTLAGVASGTISMNDLRGKSNQFNFTISGNQTNANLRTLAVNAGWNQTSKVVATINSGIYISSNGTGTPALTVNGSFPGGVQLINNGFIAGMGGSGGAGGSSTGTLGPPQTGRVGNAGGGALSVSVAITITNNGTVAGGGGGGGGGGAYYTYDENTGRFTTSGPGGGGGGGRSSAAANSAGGAGGVSSGYPSGSFGGAGTVSASGAGGNGGGPTASFFRGGSGGGWGAGGSSGLGGYSGGTAGGAAGGAGYAVSGNGNISWAATGTRLGAIS